MSPYFLANILVRQLCCTPEECKPAGQANQTPNSLLSKVSCRLVPPPTPAWDQLPTDRLLRVGFGSGLASEQPRVPVFARRNEASESFTNVARLVERAGATFAKALASGGVERDRVVVAILIGP